MARHKVLAIGLDGLDVTLAERFMAEGQMPALANLRKRAARFLLDEGAALHTGLPWEHVASGLSPEAGGRWSPVDFDPSSYTAWQDGAHFAPWWAETDLRVVVFDSPFVDLRRARNTKGIVAWGSHNPGTVTAARPAALLAEFVQRFGDYPAVEWTYATPWPSAARARMMEKDSVRPWMCAAARPIGWPLNDSRSGTSFSPSLASFTAVWRGYGTAWTLAIPSTRIPQAGRPVLHCWTYTGPWTTWSGSSSTRPAMPQSSRSTWAGWGRPLRYPVDGSAPRAALPPRLRSPASHAPPAWTATPNRMPGLDDHDSWETATASWVPGPPRDSG